MQIQRSVEMNQTVRLWLNLKLVLSLDDQCRSTSGTVVRPSCSNIWSSTTSIKQSIYFRNDYSTKATFLYLMNSLLMFKSCRELRNSSTDENNLDNTGEALAAITTAESSSSRQNRRTQCNVFSNLDFNQCKVLHFCSSTSGPHNRSSSFSFQSAIVYK